MPDFRLARWLGRFGANRRGNVAVIAGLVFMALIVVGGAAIDLHRAYTARSQGQDALDLAGVAAASTRHTDPALLEQVARDYLDANAEIGVLEADPDITVEIESVSRIDMRLQGSVRTFFMGLIGINTLPVDVSTAVERGAVDRVELALVLDNTYSMVDPADATGTRKIDALKTAARDLVDALMTREDDSVKVGVVPYGDYVNVGMSRRNSSWLDVPADYSTTRVIPKSCTTTRRTCSGGRQTTCTRTRDGVTETYACTQGQTCRNETIPEKCTPERTQTDRYRWLGCVGSRRQGQSRLNDTGTQTYPGLMVVNSTQPNCLTEITPLTTRKQTVTSALSAMIITRTNYFPETYIPAGAIWGVNMLSPTAPLTEAADYQSENRNPRKIMVLMTDGTNTMRFNASDGKHANTTNTAQLTATNQDTASICTYAKSKGIEIYTVALAVKSTAARDLLQSCASDPSHYFNADDSSSLARAFADIAASIYRVRIVE